MPIRRLYHVRIKGRPNRDHLVEASSKESAIQRATKPSVISCTIPSPLEALRLQAEGAVMHHADGSVTDPLAVKVPDEPKPIFEGGDKPSPVIANLDETEACLGIRSGDPEHPQDSQLLAEVTVPMERAGAEAAAEPTEGGGNE